MEVWSPLLSVQDLSDGDDLFRFYPDHRCLHRRTLRCHLPSLESQDPYKPFKVTQGHCRHMDSRLCHCIAVSCLHDNLPLPGRPRVRPTTPRFPHLQHPSAVARPDEACLPVFDVCSLRPSSDLDFSSLRPDRSFDSKVRVGDVQRSLDRRQNSIVVVVVITIVRSIASSEDCPQNVRYRHIIHAPPPHTDVHQFSLTLIVSVL